MIEEVLDNVYECILSENSILVKIRGGEGLDEEQFKSLKNSLEILCEHYKEKEVIPKKLALCFVDISNYFYFNEGYYEEIEENRLEDAVHEISFYADRLFGS